MRISAVLLVDCPCPYAYTGPLRVLVYGRIIVHSDVMNHATSKILSDRCQITNKSIMYVSNVRFFLGLPKRSFVSFVIPKFKVQQQKELNFEFLVRCNNEFIGDIKRRTALYTLRRYFTLPELVSISNG